MLAPAFAPSPHWAFALWGTSAIIEAAIFNKDLVKKRKLDQNHEKGDTAVAFKEGLKAVHKQAPEKFAGAVMDVIEARKEIP